MKNLKELILKNSNSVKYELNKFLSKSEEYNNFVVDGLYQVPAGKGFKKDQLMFTLYKKGVWGVELIFNIETLRLERSKTQGKHKKSETEEMTNFADWLYIGKLQDVVRAALMNDNEIKNIWDTMENEKYTKIAIEYLNVLKERNEKAINNLLKIHTFDSTIEEVEERIVRVGKINDNILIDSIVNEIMTILSEVEGNIEEDKLEETEQQNDNNPVTEQQRTVESNENKEQNALNMGQKWFDIIVTYNGNEIKHGLWAKDIDDARDKAYFKWINADKREVVCEELTQNKKEENKMLTKTEFFEQENNQEQITYIVGNRSFPSYSEAEKYCNDCDFDHDMIIVEGGNIPPSTHNTTPIDLQFFSAVNPITEPYTVNEYDEKVYSFNHSKKIDVNHIKSLFDSLSYTGTRYNNKPDSYAIHDTITHIHTYNGSDGEVMEIGFTSGLILSAKCFSDFDNMVTTVLNYINGNTVTMTTNETVYTPRQLNKKGHTEVRKPNLNIKYTVEYTDKDEEININYSNLKKFEVNDLNSLVMDVATLRKDNYNIRAYMEIYEGEKLIASDMVTTDIEFVPSATEREHIKQLRLENEQIKRDMEHVNAYNAFLKKHKAEKLFEKFLEEEWYKKK